MFNLFKVLQEREINGKKNLHPLIDKKFEDNIQLDNRVDHKITLDSDFRRLGRCGKFIAIYSKNQLSLFDASISKKLWSVQVDNLDDYACDRLLVTDAGLVLYVAHLKGVHFNYHPQIQIFSEGKKVGSFKPDDTCFSISSLRVINDRIFGVSQSWEVRGFYEWDLNGNLIRALSMDNLKKSGGSTIDSSNDYYIVSAHDEGMQKKLPVFVFDIHKNESKTFNLFETETESNDIEIDSIKILNNNLVIGYHYQKITPEYSFKVSRNPRVNIIDLGTYKTLNEFYPEYDHGQIKNLTVNNNYIVFLLYEGSTGGDNLYCIDMRKNTVGKIKQIPYCVEGSLDITLTGSTLIACCPSGYWNYGGAALERYVINLDTKENLQHIRYRRFPWDNPSFSNGIFVVPTNCTSEKAIYTENFHNLDNLNASEKIPSNSIRIKR
jgi:hypothetical protein